MEISRIAGSFPQERFADTLSESSGDSCYEGDDGVRGDDAVTVRVSDYVQR